jgi:prophage antirepressor-like protein
MDILKAFKINTDEFHVNIQGTHEEPLFQANQIAKILDIKKIRNSIKDFNEDEKGALSTDTLGGEQKCLFITEKNYIVLLHNQENL